jgi:CRP-like cAMP-binding protein
LNFDPKQLCGNLEYYFFSEKHMPNEIKSLNFKNSFIQTLSAQDVEDLCSCLESVEMPLGMKIYDPYCEIKHIYFPETSIISIVTLLQSGNGVETAIVGKEGFSGVETILAENGVPREAMVQLGGMGYRAKVSDFKHLFEKNKTFSEQVLRYLYPFVTQIAQNSACLCYHSIEKRLARWLLMFHERAASDELQLTQEFIAMMLGVHRQNLNKNINKLQQENLISYNRGRIRILSRAGLLESSCECYEVIKTAFAGYLRQSENFSNGN